MENIPKESETIAHKRNLRIAEKLKSTREKFTSKKSWWTNGLTEFLGLLLIFTLNLILIFPFFGKPANSVSFSGPVVPLLAKGVALLGINLAYAIQIINIVFFLIFPITFYYFVKIVSGRKFSAFLATLVASLPFYLFAKTRVEFGIIGTDSAYIASLSLLPLALVTLLNFLKKGGIKNLALASVVAAITALTSPFGFFIFMVTSLITAFSEFLLGSGRLKILRLLMVYVFAGSFSSFWYNPVFFFWMLTGPMGEDLRMMLSKLIPISLFAVPILACLGYLVFDRKPDLQPVFLALFYSIVFAMIVFVRGGFMISDSNRYIPVLGISLAFLFGSLVVKLVESLAERSNKIFYDFGLKNMILVGFSALMIITTYLCRWMVSTQENDILGIWTDVEKGNLWVMNDVFSSKYSLIGDVITLGGICFLTFLYINYKKSKTTAFTKI